MNTKFRIEKRTSKGGDDKYYLVYPVTTPKRKTKITRLIKTGEAPTDAEFEKAVLEYSEEFMTRAASKYAEFRANAQSYLYIPRFLGKELEKTRYGYLTHRASLSEPDLIAYDDLYDAHYVSGTAGLEGIQAGSEKLIRNFRLVRTCRETAVQKVTPEYVREIHGLILMDSDVETGVFRDADDVEAKLQKALDEYYSRVENGYCVFEEAVLFLYRFLVISPFNIANGLVAREIFNFMLECDNYPRLVFPARFAQLYTMALDFGDKKDYQRMITLFASISMRQTDVY